VPSLWERLNKGIVISDSPYSCVIFASKVLKKLQAIVNKKIDVCESGGLLLGFVRGSHFDIRMITIPYEKDSVSRYLFVRNDVRHFNYFQWIQSRINKNITYIGEWHTHPEDDPKPSSIDLKEWDFIKSTRSYPILFMIIGRKNFYITVK
jgi:integrative and conjugative element protein (TIGR02256 family)